MDCNNNILNKDIYSKDEYIWGLDCHGNIVSGFDHPVLTDIDLYKDGDTGEYVISVETIYDFENICELIDYIEYLLTGLRTFLSDKDIVEPYVVKWYDSIEIGLIRGKTISEVYEKFAFVANALISYYKTV